MTFPSPITGNGKWRGGALSPDGRIYISAADNANFAILDPNTRQLTTITSPFGGGNKWGGAKMTGDGIFVSIPHADTNIIFIKTNSIGKICNSVSMSSYFN